MEEIILKRKKSIWIFPSVFSFGLGIAIFFLYDERLENYQKLHFILFSLFCFMVISPPILTMIPGVSYLTVNNNGIEFRNFLIKHKYDWNQISNFRLIRENDANVLYSNIIISLLGGGIASLLVLSNPIIFAVEGKKRLFNFILKLLGFDGFTHYILDFTAKLPGKQKELSSQELKALINEMKEKSTYMH